MILHHGYIRDIDECATDLRTMLGLDHNEFSLGDHIEVFAQLCDNDALILDEDDTFFYCTSDEHDYKIFDSYNDLEVRTIMEDDGLPDIEGIIKAFQRHNGVFSEKLPIERLLITESSDYALLDIRHNGDAIYAH